MSKRAADFYTCDADAEEYQHTTLKDAVVEYFEGIAHHAADDIETLIELETPLTVHLAKRVAVDPEWVEAQAGSMLYEFAERWADEYGGPDANNHLAKTNSQPAKAALRAIEPALRRYAGTGKVWNCSIVGEKALTGKQVRALLKREAPWFWPPKETRDVANASRG